MIESLFNSYEFIFIFLPITLGGYFLLGGSHRFLILASLIFYAYWDLNFLPILLGSMIVNFLIAGRILESKHQKQFFIAGLIFNIGLLSYFKYLPPEKILPLGISFFTITQLLYLYDCFAGVAKDHDSIRYALFVSFFPHLLAGPILYHRQMMKQFRDESLKKINFENLSRGLILFTIGLSKKVLIADQLSPFVAENFSNPNDLSMIQAWIVASSYTLQLFFDFSGYSDMAVGLARMMNFEIPINFNAPYRATNLINFWQRWHISLTNAITACVYLPIMKFFKSKTILNTCIASFVTFFIVGIWHGSGWTFFCFAMCTASSIVVNYLWRSMGFSLPKIPSHILLMMFVISTMVFLRSDNLDIAMKILGSMFAGDLEFPRKIVELTNYIGLNLNVGNVPGDLPKSIFLIGILIVIFAPTSNQIVKKIEPRFAISILIGAILFIGILQLSSVTEFLYFQF
ncbi:MAG: MBOAT family protein [Selenomonadaceae bacterium]|nr:MBOAT family protein [Selenomonadaceae bacterium]